MKFKPVRSLAVLMAVLMIFMALPAVPASAATTATSITIKKAEGINKVILFDGSKGDYDAACNADEGNTVCVLWYDEEEAGTEISIGGVEYSITSSDGGYKIALKSGESKFTKSINLGFVVDAKSLEYEAKGNVETEIAQGSISMVSQDANEGLYEGKLNAAFAQPTGQWSRFKTSTSVTLTLSVPTPEYTVTWNTSSYWGLYSDKACQDEQKQVSGYVTVKQGETFKFYIKPTNSRQIPLVSATAGSKTISVKDITKEEGCSTGVYAYQIDGASIDNNIVLTVDLADPVSVTFNAPTGATVTGNTTIPYGSKDAYTFTVTAKAGFAIDSVTAKYHGENIEVKAPEGSKEGQYSITAPKDTGFVGSLEITVTVSAVEYKVTLKSGTTMDGTGYGISFRSNTTVGYNGEFSFDVSPDDGYNAPKVTIWAGGLDITADHLHEPANGGTTYTIYGITDNVEIQVTAGDQITYQVRFPASGNGYTVKVTKDGGEVLANGNSVPYGTELTIEVTVNDNYSKSIDSLVVSNNNIPLHAEESAEGLKRTYKLTVTAAVSLSITGLTINTYTVTIPVTSTEYTVSGQSTNTYPEGSSIRFSLTLDDAYELVGSEKDLFSADVRDAEGVSISKSGSTISVTVTGLKSDLDFTVQADQIQIKKFAVAKPKDAGYTFTFTTPSDGESVTVVYGGEITFNVVANTNDGYKIESVSYTMGGGNAMILNPTSGNSYRIRNVTGDVVITVTTSRSFTVQMAADGSGYDVEYSGGLSVPEGSSITFTVTVKDGWKLADGYSFDKDTKAVTVDGSEYTVSVNGKTATFTISNVTGDVTVSIVDEAFAGEKYSVTDSTQANKDGYTISYSDGREGENISYGSTLTISVKAKDGYEVSHVRYTMGGGKAVEVNDARCFISSVEGDIKLEVDCTVTEYTVVYNFPSVTVCGIQFDHTYISKTYKMTDNDHASRFTGEGSNFAIVLEDFTTLNSDTSFDGCTLNSWSNGQSKVSNVLVGDSRRFEVTADWSVNFTTSATDDGATDTAFGVKEEKVTVQNNGDKVKATCTGSLTTNLKGDLEKLVDGHFTVERCGLVFAAAERNLTTETLNTYRDKVRGLQSSDWLDEGRSDVYCFTYDASNQGMKLGDKFKMNVNSSASGATRFGAVFFLVRFNDGTREVFFGNIQDCSLNVNA